MSSQLTFYSPDDVAKILGISTAKVYELIASGELRATTIGRQYRISEEALQDYIRKHTKP